MLDLLRVLVGLRLAVMAIVAGGALLLLAVWSLSHGAPVTGIAILTGLAVCVGMAAMTLRRLRRTR